MNEAALFELVLKTPDAERELLLARACAGNAELRQRVQGMLLAHEESEELQGAVPGQAAGTEATSGFVATSNYTSTDPLPGMVIAGRYTLEQRIGEGGMGEVWIAKQSEPVKRKVALKLIKAGMDSKSVVQRFEQERQALAMMDHPNIAKVLDGGLTANRRPFFVMELVNGLSLTRFCDEAKLSIRERLEIFVPICQSVQHAHQKGIVHRDLKPSNILVINIDGKPTPKVIDFGVAKATSGRLTEDSLSTQFGAVVGTLEYMSPEQAGFTGEDIDTRADIYSLGVILYELLTGLRPIDARRLKKAAMVEMIRIIKEEEPSKPSTRLSTDESAPSLAALRHAEPKKLSAMLRGELDWVVMKCLEKQRERRYETANGLARDIQRYLANEPIEAKPPSAGYRLRKLISRNRGKVIAAGLVALALVGGIIGTTWGLLEAQRQKVLAEVARDSETKRAESEARERLRAEKAEAQAKKRADELEQVAEFQSKQFEGIDVPLTGVRLRNDLLDKVKAAGVKANLKPEENAKRVAEAERVIAGADFAGMAVKTLEQNVFVPALSAIEKEFTAQPLVQARLQQSLAVIIRELGLYDLAVAPQQAALATRRGQLGEDHPDTLESIRSMSSLLRMQGKVKEAEPLLLQALEGYRKVCGPEDPRTLLCENLVAVLRSVQGRWEEQAKLHAASLEKHRRVLGEEHKETLDLMSGLGSALTNAGKFDEAEKILLKTYESFLRTKGAEDRGTLVVANNLGALYYGMDRMKDAERYYRIAVEGLQRTMSDLHPQMIAATDNMGAVLMRLDRLEEAIVYTSQALRSRRLLFGEDHLQTLRSVHNMAVMYRAQKNLVEAEANYRKAYEGFRRLLGPDRPDTLIVASNFAIALRDQKKYEEAEKLFRMVIERRTATLGAKHASTIAGVNNLAELLDQTSRYDEKLRLLIENEPSARAAYTGSQRKSLGDYLSRLGDTYLRVNKYPESDAALKEAYTLLLPGYGPTSDATMLCRDRQITLYRRWHAAEPGKGHDAQADAMIEEAVKTTQTQLAETRTKASADNLALSSALAKAGTRLLKLKRYVEAEPILRECLTIREKTQPTVWQTFNTSSMLGEALLGQKKYTDAETLLLKGYAGLKEREQTLLNTILPEAIDRLIELYTATNKPEEVKKWQAEKEKLTKQPVKK
jgi:serine/threonine protein kinase/Tfp pilus assembly protein PilF